MLSMVEKFRLSASIITGTVAGLWLCCQIAVCLMPSLLTFSWHTQQRSLAIPSLHPTRCCAFPPTGHVIDHQATLFALRHWALQQSLPPSHPCIVAIASLALIARRQLLRCALLLQVRTKVGWVDAYHPSSPTSTGLDNFWKVISLATAAVCTLLRFALHLPSVRPSSLLQ